MIIAIPSVTKYISDSRKSAYVDTAKEVIGSARNLINSGELEMYDTNTTYYIPVSAITYWRGNSTERNGEEYVGVRPVVIIQK